MAKTMTFAGAHFTVAFSVGYALTGSPWVGGALAVIEPTINTVVFYFHEKIWQRVEARRRGLAPGSGAAMGVA
ncbi:MAG TPA: DUF2061 domain-containing protein [Cellvibrionaceae bacterium]|nr:DUF2061 domain-containing protein [Cellvibrionaceae bacterium]